MCDMYYIRTSLASLNSSSLGVDVTLKCFLKNRDHALCMMCTRSWNFFGGFFKESHTVTRDRSISITSRIQWKLLIHTWLEEMFDIYTYWLIEVTKKSQRTHSKLYENRMNVRSCCPSKDMNILFSVRLGHLRTLSSCITFGSMKPTL